MTGFEVVELSSPVTVADIGGTAFGGFDGVTLCGEGAEDLADGRGLVKGEYDPVVALFKGDGVAFRGEGDASQSDLAVGVDLDFVHLVLIQGAQFSSPGGSGEGGTAVVLRLDGDGGVAAQGFHECSLELFQGNAEVG